MKTGKLTLVLLIFVTGFLVSVHGQTAANPAQLPQRDGAHDFDFLIGDWKAHVRRLPDRLNNSNAWVEYDGISNHKKILTSNANFEEFEVTSTDKKLHIKEQTLRLYNPASRQWSIYPVNVDNGTLDAPRWSAISQAIEGSFTIRKTSRAGQFWCATYGSTSRHSRRAWSSRFRRTAERRGR